MSMNKAKVVTATGNPTQWAKTVDFMLRTGGMKGVDPARDVLHLALDEHENVIGLVAAQNVVLFHEFRVDQLRMRYHTAEALWHYGMGSARSAGYTEGILLVDASNDAMLRFVEGRSKSYGGENQHKVLLVEIG